MTRDWTPNFWSTDTMTDHGVFRAYVAKRNPADSDAYPRGYDPESAEHVLLECSAPASLLTDLWTEVL